MKTQRINVPRDVIVEVAPGVGLVVQDPPEDYIVDVEIAVPGDGAGVDILIRVRFPVATA